MEEEKENFANELVNNEISTFIGVGYDVGAKTLNLFNFYGTGSKNPEARNDALMASIVAAEPEYRTIRIPHSFEGNEQILNALKPLKSMPYFFQYPLKDGPPCPKLSEPREITIPHLVDQYDSEDGEDTSYVDYPIVGFNMLNPAEREILNTGGGPIGSEPPDLGPLKISLKFAAFLRNLIQNHLEDGEEAEALALEDRAVDAKKLADNLQETLDNHYFGTSGTKALTGRIETTYKIYAKNSFILGSLGQTVGTPDYDVEPVVALKALKRYVSRARKLQMSCNGLPYNLDNNIFGEGFALSPSKGGQLIRNEDLRDDIGIVMREYYKADGVNKMFEHQYPRLLPDYPDVRQVVGYNIVNQHTKINLTRAHLIDPISINLQSSAGPMFPKKKNEDIKFDILPNAMVLIKNLGNPLGYLGSLPNRQSDFLRLCKITAKQEVYEKSKISTKERAIYGTNYLTQIPAALFIKYFQYNTLPFYMDRDYKGPQIKARYEDHQFSNYYDDTCKVRVMYPFSHANGVPNLVRETARKMVSSKMYNITDVLKVSKVGALVYADNVYMFWKLQKRVDNEWEDEWVWESLDGSSMEASHSPIRAFFQVISMFTDFGMEFPDERLVEFIGYLQSIMLKPDNAGRDVDSTALAVKQIDALIGSARRTIEGRPRPYFDVPDVLPFIDRWRANYTLKTFVEATIGIGMIGNFYFIIPGLGSGMPGTFYLNTTMMADATAMVVDEINMQIEEDASVLKMMDPNLEDVEDGFEVLAGMHAHLKQAYADIGLTIKVELTTTGTKCWLQDLDLMRPDVIYLTDLLGVDMKNVTIGGFSYLMPVLQRERLLKAMCFVKSKTALKLAKAGKEDHLLLTVTNLTKYRALYLAGGYADPEIATVLQSLCVTANKIVSTALTAQDNRELLLKAARGCIADLAGEEVELFNPQDVEDEYTQIFGKINKKDSDFITASAVGEVPTLNDVYKLYTPKDNDYFSNLVDELTYEFLTPEAKSHMTDWGGDMDFDEEAKSRSYDAPIENNIMAIPTTVFNPKDVSGKIINPYLIDGNPRNFGQVVMDKDKYSSMVPKIKEVSEEVARLWGSQEKTTVDLITFPHPLPVNPKQPFINMPYRIRNMIFKYTVSKGVSKFILRKNKKLGEGKYPDMAMATLMVHYFFRNNLKFVAELNKHWARYHAYVTPSPIDTLVEFPYVLDWNNYLKNLNKYPVVRTYRPPNTSNYIKLRVDSFKGKNRKEKGKRMKAHIRNETTFGEQYYHGDAAEHAEDESNEYPDFDDEKYGGFEW